MKVKDFICKLEDIGYDNDTEIVFDLKNKDSETYSDFYCQSIYRHMDGLNAMGVEISRNYKKEIHIKETELQKIANNISSEFNKITEQLYILGQASVISSILYCINDKNFESKDVKKYLKLYLDKNKELKSMTYDCIKDY